MTQKGASIDVSFLIWPFQQRFVVAIITREVK